MENKVCACATLNGEKKVLTFAFSSDLVILKIMGVKHDREYGLYTEQQLEMTHEDAAFLLKELCDTMYRAGALFGVKSKSART